MLAAAAVARGAGGADVLIVLPPGVFELSSVVSLPGRVFITGAGVGRTFIAGGCGAGGILVAAGASASIRNASLAGVLLAAAGPGADVDVRNASISWDGCGCAPMWSARGGGAMRVGSAQACAPVACGGLPSVAVEGGGTFVAVDVEVGACGACA
jgi:hypothetical protein